MTYVGHDNERDEVFGTPMIWSFPMVAAIPIVTILVVPGWLCVPADTDDRALDDSPPPRRGRVAVRLARTVRARRNP